MKKISNSELPKQIYMLTNLKTLSIDGNPSLKEPPKHILNKGVSSVLGYFHDKDKGNSKRRQIPII